MITISLDEVEQSLLLALLDAQPGLPLELSRFRNRLALPQHAQRHPESVGSGPLVSIEFLIDG